MDQDTDILIEDLKNWHLWSDEKWKKEDEFLIFDLFWFATSKIVTTATKQHSHHPMPQLLMKIGRKR
jgi:hypothetical protein